MSDTPERPATEPARPDVEPERVRDPRLLELAMRVVDDAPVDWEEARETTGDLASTLERLREIQRVAAVSAPPPVAEPAAAFVWGRLRALEKLGEGGFGEVWRAWDPALQREVALKLRRAGDAPGVARWLREAQALARVRHPNVVAIYGADTHDDRTGIWMELIRGHTLEWILQELGPLGAREAAAIGVDLCAALASVHHAGLVHGDVKTRNVMREGTRDSAGAAGRVVLMDFGTARLRDGVAGDGGSSAGTPLFAAPELLEGAAPTAASDLYALGVVLYRLVTGRFPVEATSLAALRARHAEGRHEPLRALRPDLPQPFVQAVERALAHDPRQRFRDAAEMEHALAASLGGTRGTMEIRTSGARLLAAAAAGALAIGLVWGGVRWVPEWLRPKFRVQPSGPALATRALQTLPGATPSGLFGFSVACPGDIDGDGIPDLLVGAPGEGNGDGVTHLYRGRPDGTFAPWRTFEHSGYSVAALGDVNHDGIPDFAVGCPSDDRNGRYAGAVRVYFGDRTQGGVLAATYHGRRTGAELGYAVAGAGDVNGDGYADILASAPLDATDGAAAGIAYVWFGGPTLREKPDLELKPGSIGGQFGIAVAGIGDFNGDGYADIAVGANVDRRLGAGTGRVAIYFGGRAMSDKPALDLYGPRSDTWFGISILGLGDVDGDGFDDLAVGAERGDGFTPRSGNVSIFRGSQHPSPVPWKVIGGPEDYCRFGHALASGDVLGNGRRDLVVGGYYVTDVGSAAGAAYVYDLGRQREPVAELELTGTDSHGNLGTSVATIPGLAGGHAGVIAGAPYSSSMEGGAVWVYGVSRNAFTRPHGGERWTSGARVPVAWLGAARADLEWAPVAGGAWRALARGVGGRDQNAATITVPAEARCAIRLRLMPLDRTREAPALSDTIEIETR